MLFFYFIKEFFEHVNFRSLSINVQLILKLKKRHLLKNVLIIVKMVKELGYTIIIYVTNSGHRPCVIVLAKTKCAFTPNV